MLRKVELSKTSSSEQARIISALIKEDGCRRVAVDATGLGMQMAEDLEREFGPMVEGITFTAAAKEALANETKRSFEDKLTRIFIDDKLREDLHRVKRVVTSTGNFRFDAERTEDGHADRFWALALAEHAETEPDGAQFFGIMPGGVDIYGTGSGRNVG
jgi:phage FluMu gp28-like protein